MRVWISARSPFFARCVSTILIGPWRAGNPSEVGRLAELLAEVGRGRRLVVAMEPTGTYGDMPCGKRWSGIGVAVHRGVRRMPDYAEVRLTACPRSMTARMRRWWPSWRPRPVLAVAVAATDRSGSRSYHVQWLDGQRRQMMVWCGRGSVIEPSLAGSDVGGDVVVGDFAAVAWRRMAVPAVWRRQRMVWP